MRIAVFDYQVIKNNPIGSCHRRMLGALALEHDFTVFSVAFDNPCPERIKWVRVPVPLRPLALLFVAYHMTAPLVYWLYRIRTGIRFDLVQTVESNLSFGSVIYSHFCHRSFLKNHWNATAATGLRGFLRWLDHELHAWLESKVYESSKHILTPSIGLASELNSEFPGTTQKTQVLPNAIEAKQLQCPTSFDRDGFRAKLGIRATDVVFCFAALGHFERKGLPLLLEALSRLNAGCARLLVIGGTAGLLDIYRARASAIGMRDQVIFAGMQSDIRPYFWASDAFAFASSYETFSLVVFEAAAASLPLITPLLHGVEEIVSDGRTGYVVRRTVADLVTAMKRFLALSAQERAAMGEQARLHAMKYSEERFINNWRKFYGTQMVDCSPASVPATQQAQTVQTAS